MSPCFDHDVSDIDVDPKSHLSRFEFLFVRTRERLLDFDRTANRVEHAGEFSKNAVSGCVRDPTFVLQDASLNDDSAGG
jgi:hypothetical protein